MKITPTNLNLPLEQKEFLGLQVAAVCAGVTVVAALFNPQFAIAFAASTVVVLPIVLLMFFPSVLSSKLPRPGNTGLGRITIYLVMFGHIALAKNVLVPFVTGIIEHALL